MRSIIMGGLALGTALWLKRSGGGLGEVDDERKRLRSEIARAERMMEELYAAGDYQNAAMVARSIRSLEEKIRGMGGLGASRMADRFLRNEGFDDLIEAQTRDSIITTPLIDYTATFPGESRPKTKMDTIKEFCQKKRSGEYVRVFRIQNGVKREICL